MRDVIKLLPEGIANQIAAGEVVQRPASVVKELLENSVDAGATNISLIIRESGKSLIQVVDNGDGMSPTDARMSFERHATSKIRKTEDIFQIRTMGFRGEALASIAAVAQVELRTKKDEAELGTEVIVHASSLKGQEPVASKKGTSICVKNLFYNIPARRSFLKSNPVEFKHINDEFHRVVLAHPEIAFSFFQNDQEIHRLDPGKLSKRIIQLFGKNYQNQMIPCQEHTPDIQVTGYVGKPEFSKKTRGEQFFFVNGRYIKNNYLGHAVTSAFEGLMPVDFFPFYVLFLEIDPARVDINVHPTKTEVKFQDDRLLYGVIRSAVRQALAQFNVTPSLDFEADINFEFSSQRLPGRDSASPEERSYASYRSLDAAAKRSQENWRELYDVARKEEEREREQAQNETPLQTITVTSDLDAGQPSGRSHKSLQLHGQYVIRQVKSGMVMIDQSAAHERILYEKYLAILDGGMGASQSCLFPQHIQLNTSDYSLLNELKSEIRQLGFDFEPFGDRGIVVNGVPADLAGSNEKEILEGLIEQFKSNQETLSLDHRHNLARSLASRTAIRKGKELGEREVDELVEQLFACRQPNYTPGGSPTFVVLGLERIAGYFKK